MESSCRELARQSGEDFATSWVKAQMVGGIVERTEKSVAQAGVDGHNPLPPSSPGRERARGDERRTEFRIVEAVKGIILAASVAATVVAAVTSPLDVRGRARWASTSSHASSTSGAG